MFEKGQLVAHETAGVCRVAEIIEMAFRPGEPKKTYYKLAPVYENGTLFTPVESDKVFIRPVLSKEEILTLIDGIPGIDAEAYHTRSLQELGDHYQEALASHDCGVLIELVMSIWLKKQDAEQNRRRLGQVDTRYLKQAEDLLYGEFAAVLEIQKDEVQPFIDRRLAEAGYSAANAPQDANA